MYVMSAVRHALLRENGMDTMCLFLGRKHSDLSAPTKSHCTGTCRTLFQKKTQKTNPSSCVRKQLTVPNIYLKGACPHS